MPTLAPDALHRGHPARRPPRAQLARLERQRRPRLARIPRLPAHARPTRRAARHRRSASRCPAPPRLPARAKGRVGGVAGCRRVLGGAHQPQPVPTRPSPLRHNPAMPMPMPAKKPPTAANIGYTELGEATRVSQKGAVQVSRILAALHDARLPKLIPGELRVRDAARVAGSAC